MKKELRKYQKSTFRNELIDELYVNSNTSFIVKTRKHEETFYISTYNNTDCRELSADYLICEIQNDVDIIVRKF